MRASETELSEIEASSWEDMFHAILRGVDEAIVIRRPGGQIVYANELAAHLLGFDSVSELLATSIEQINSKFEFYAESGEVISTTSLPGVLALAGTELTTSVMRFRLLLTGEERWAEIKAVPVRDRQGRVQYAASIFHDITERRRAQEALRASEARFQAFMDNSPIVAFIKDEEGRFVYVNPQFERAFHVNASEIVGVSDTQVVPEEVAERIHKDDIEVLSTGKMKQIVEVIPEPGGALHTWVTFKFPMSIPPEQGWTGHSGKSRGTEPRRFVAGASVDISERVQAQHELQNYAERLQALSRQLIEAQEAERRRIARDLHDQIGQVLTAVKIDLQVAQRQISVDDERRRTKDESDASFVSGPSAASVRRLDQSINMVDHAIQQVRAFSLDLRPSILDDLGLASAMLWYVEEQARRAGLQPEVAIEQLDTRLPGEIEIACFRVAQEAITNVVRHAKASRVKVELRRCGQELRLAVADDGVGFAQMRSGEFGMRNAQGSQVPRSEDAPASQLSNLGLAGMYERVRLVGGQLSIESEPGKGTTVIAVFPLPDKAVSN